MFLELFWKNQFSGQKHLIESWGGVGYSDQFGLVAGCLSDFFPTFWWIFQKIQNAPGKNCCEGSACLRRTLWALNARTQNIWKTSGGISSLINARWTISNVLLPYHSSTWDPALPKGAGDACSSLLEILVTCNNRVSKINKTKGIQFEIYFADTIIMTLAFIIQDSRL